MILNKMTIVFLKKIQADLISVLINDGAKKSGQHLTKIECPSCGKRESWTFIHDPLTIHCNRKNDCGASISAKKLFPEIFQDFTKRFPATKENPNASAKAFLASRKIHTENLPFEQRKIYQKFYCSLRISNGAHWNRIIDEKEGICEKLF